MNATIRSDKIEATEVDSNLAAVTEVEAGIRDFVRNDVAYLRRPAPSMVSSIEPALEPSAEATEVESTAADQPLRRPSAARFHCVT